MGLIIYLLESHRLVNNGRRGGGTWRLRVILARVAIKQGILTIAKIGDIWFAERCPRDKDANLSTGNPYVSNCELVNAVYTENKSKGEVLIRQRQRTSPGSPQKHKGLTVVENSLHKGVECYKYTMLASKCNLSWQEEGKRQKFKVWRCVRV